MRVRLLRGRAMVTRLIAVLGWTACALACFAVRHRWSRTVLNYVYLRLTSFPRTCVYSWFAKIFSDTDSTVQPGLWKVMFAGKEILLPLKSERIWLDWDLALSVVGHDMEVVQTYESLLCSTSRPDLFLDIGANYGTHSLLFLVQRVRCLTFEPNASCQGVFEEHCALNHVTGQFVPVALGASDGTVRLRYPEKNTWWGSTTGQAAPGTEGLDLDVKEEEVVQRRLDSYLDRIAHELQRPFSHGKAEVGALLPPRLLIKIDTEGSEYQILRGASSVIERYRPLMIFECFPGDHRTHLIEYLIGIQYQVFRLPWSPLVRTQPLSRDEFLTSRAVNFMAVFRGGNGDCGEKPGTPGVLGG